MCNISRISKLGKENILSTLNHFSGNLHGTTHSSLPERHIKYMMQTKRNQCTLDQTKDQCSHITGSCYQSAQCINTILDYRPYKIQKDSHKHIYNRGNDRYKTGSSKKGKSIWKLYPVESIMQGSYSQSYNNAAKHTHLK